MLCEGYANASSPPVRVRMLLPWCDATEGRQGNRAFTNGHSQCLVAQSANITPEHGLVGEGLVCSRHIGTRETARHDGMVVVFHAVRGTIKQTPLHNGSEKGEKFVGTGKRTDRRRPRSGSKKLAQSPAAYTPEHASSSELTTIPPFFLSISRLAVLAS